MTSTQTIHEAAKEGTVRFDRPPAVLDPPEFDFQQEHPMTSAVGGIDPHQGDCQKMTVPADAREVDELIEFARS